MNTKAIAYARCSTDMQEASIPEQKKAIEEYASKNDLGIIRWFEDEGKSGRNAEERPAFMSMVDYVRSSPNDFKFVLVYDCSRWGRFENPKEATYWEVMIEKCGKKVKYITEDYINDDSIGAYVTKVVKDSEASEFSKKLSKVSFRGHRHYAELGYQVGGSAKYGYKRLLVDEYDKPVSVLGDGEHKALKTHHIRLVKGDPAEVAIVQRIYDLYVNRGYGIAKIVDILNSENIPAPRKKPQALTKGWSNSSVWNILHDETYIGWIVWNKNVYKNFHEKDKNWGRYKPREEWVICKNAHEPLVEEEIFNRVKAKTRQAFKGGYKFKGAGRGYYSPYLLSGMVKCLKCCGNFQGRAVSHFEEKKAYRHYYYVCGTYNMKGKYRCVKWNIPKETMESFALDGIRRRLNSPEWINGYRDRLRKTLSVITKESSGDIEQVDKELKDVQNRLGNIIDAIEKGQDKDILGERLTELKAKRDRLLDMRTQAKNRTDGCVNIDRLTKAGLERFKRFDKLFERGDITEKKAFLKRWIVKIDVDPIEKKCYYYFLKTPEFEEVRAEGNLVLLNSKATLPTIDFKRV
ncbi:MAG: recombinase family protein [Candidatus Omnitrophota bacterium]|nr:recombinase family protein [Candidatus Omnitrophota bacterium]